MGAATPSTELVEEPEGWVLGSRTHGAAYHLSNSGEGGAITRLLSFNFHPGAHARGDDREAERERRQPISHYHHLESYDPMAPIPCPFEGCCKVSGIFRELFVKS